MSEYPIINNVLTVVCPLLQREPNKIWLIETYSLLAGIES